MKVSFECDLTWSELDGDSNVRRHCNVCDHDVFNLSGMTKEQADRLLELHRGRKLCARYLQKNGRIVHNADPAEQLHEQRSGARKLLAVALAAQAGFLAFSDDAGSSWFDPFAAIADFFDSTASSVDTKFESANNEVMGTMVEF